MAFAPARVPAQHLSTTAVTAVLGAVFAVLAVLAVLGVLVSPLTHATRAAVSTAAVVAAGAATATCCLVRSRRVSGPARTPWTLLSLAAVVALLGNGWVALTGTDPVDDPNVVGNLSVALALVLVIAGLLAFVSVGRRPRDRLVMVLDGLVVGGALLLIVSATVFPDLLRATPRGDLVAQSTTLAFPVLDSLLATLSVLVILRSPAATRLPLTLVALGFLTYGVSDILYAVRTASGTFLFGSAVDLGWVVGYLLIAAAAATPIRAGVTSSHRPAVSATSGTALILGITLLAVVVQTVADDPARPARLQGVFLVLVVAAAGTRQLLLTIDNAALRRGLERRVREQTTDLRAMVRQQEALLDSVGEGIYGVDGSGRVTFLNPAAARMLGWGADSIVGDNAHDRFHVPEPGDERHPHDACSVHRAIGGTAPTTHEERFRHADGSTFPVESTAAPLVDDQDGVRGAVVVFRDITRRLEVERRKNEFLSVASHELRTPLTAVLGSLELIATGDLGPVPPTMDRLLDIASRSSRRLARLINDLLDFERIESDARPLRLTTTDAAELVAMAVQQVQVMAADRDVRIVLGRTEGTVTADEDQVVQVLVNLLGNAAKFSPAGSTVLVETEELPGRVHLTVSDDGRGIPADKLEAVFERFTQVEPGDGKKLGGTGLGLAISKAIVERHGGRTWATSTVGVGTTMHVELPSLASSET